MVSSGRAEMTPVSSNDEKHASEGERNACDVRPLSRDLEGWDLSGDEPETGKQDQQESDLGECAARFVAQPKHYLPAARVAEPNPGYVPEISCAELMSSAQLAVWPPSPTAPYRVAEVACTPPAGAVDAVGAMMAA